MISSLQVSYVHLLIWIVVSLTLYKPDNRLLQQTIELEKKNKAIETAKNDGSNTKTAG